MSHNSDGPFDSVWMTGQPKFKVKFKERASFTIKLMVMGMSASNILYEHYEGTFYFVFGFGFTYLFLDA